MCTAVIDVVLLLCDLNFCFVYVCMILQGIMQQSDGIKNKVKSKTKQIKKRTHKIKNFKHYANFYAL